MMRDEVLSLAEAVCVSLRPFGTAVSLPLTAGLSRSLGGAGGFSTRAPSPPSSSPDSVEGEEAAPATWVVD